MSVCSSLPPLLESFFGHRLTKQRNASRSTIASYRDALRMLILFAAERAGCKPCALAVENLDRDIVLAFLDDLEQKRKNAIQTRNARLTAIRSFFHHVAANDPASLGVAQRVLAIPVKKSHTGVTRHLARGEIDALIAAPDRRTPRGRRDSDPAAFSRAYRRARFGSCRRRRLRPSTQSNATAGALARQGPQRPSRTDIG